MSSLRRRALLLACAIHALGVSACSRPAPSSGSLADPLAPLVEEAGADDWVLVFDDEFDGGALDKTKWVALEGNPNMNGTLSVMSPSMVTVHDGSLFVSGAIADAGSDAASPPAALPPLPYASGYLDTSGLFAQTYGKVEFRLRGQFAPGLWYAVWGRPWVDLVPEMDTEFLANDTSETWFVNHWALPPLPADDRRRYVTVDDMDITAFHVYTVTWKSDLVEWAIDGNAYMRVTDAETGIPHEPIFWTINSWVGGWAGAPSPETVFPAHFEVDYFRIYRLGAWGADPSIRATNPAASYSTGDTIDVAIADFDAGAWVEVHEGDQLLQTMTTPPFDFQPKSLARGAHSLTFVGSDGARSASLSMNVTID